MAPCKGNGISAQGKVNEVNDTLGPPHVPGLETIAPCRGSTSRIGATPPRHTRAQIGMQPDFAEATTEILNTYLKISPMHKTIALRMGLKKTSH